LQIYVLTKCNSGFERTKTVLSEDDPISVETCSRKGCGLINIFDCVCAFCWCMKEVICEKCTEWEALKPLSGQGQGSEKYEVPVADVCGSKQVIL
jgi:hypothetical protein